MRHLASWAGIGGTTITGAYLASRVERYLVQHPYVQTLVINAFNAGRASVLADMLLELQKAAAAFADSLRPASFRPGARRSQRG